MRRGVETDYNRRSGSIQGERIYEEVGVKDNIVERELLYLNEKIRKLKKDIKKQGEVIDMMIELIQDNRDYIKKLDGKR